MKKNMKSLITVLLLLGVSISSASAGGPNKLEDDLFWKIALIVVSAGFTGVIGYFLGTVKFFREEKHKAYGEMIPPILKMTYHPQDAKDELTTGHFCRRISQVGGMPRG